MSILSLLSSLFSKKQPEVKFKEIVTMLDHATSSGSYPDRVRHPEYTEEVINNTRALLDKVNGLLTELGVEKVRVSSGFRPSGVNAGLSNAAKRSYHMLGKAVDLLDDGNQNLARKISTRPDLLKKYELWLEDPQSTIGKNTNWCHLDDGNRQDRPSRVFKP